MGYEEALFAAGAEVHDYEYFGSYQGDWFARVTYGGTTGYVWGCYGSCSYCDGFEAEFGYRSPECSEHQYQGAAQGCAGCDAAVADYRKRLFDFGQSYLEDIKTADEIRERFVKQAEWDHDAKYILEWIDKKEKEAENASDW